MATIQAVKEIQLQIKREIESCLPKNEILFLLAVSGGRDSSVLLDAFCELLPKENIIVAHFNHGLRVESDSEQSFVEQLCRAKTVKCVVEKAVKYNDQENIEAWARMSRYDFLEKTRSEQQADYIVTAHHKTDLAETVLMRLLSGRAAISLGGIIKVDHERKLFRPLLEIPREFIDKYVEMKELKYVEDTSNSSLDRTRNRMRLELIPKIERDFNPGLVDSLSTIAQRINQDELAIWQTAKKLYEQAVNTKKAEFYSSSPAYLRWRLLKLELDSKLGQNKVGYFALSRLSELLESSEGSQKIVELGWGIKCKFSRKGMLEFLNEE